MEQEEKAGGKVGEGVGDGDWMSDVCRCSTDCVSACRLLFYESFSSAHKVGS